MSTPQSLPPEALLASATRVALAKRLTRRQAGGIRQRPAVPGARLHWMRTRERLHFIISSSTGVDDQDPLRASSPEQTLRDAPARCAINPSPALPAPHDPH